MTGDKLIIECGVAATRAALIVDDEVRKFWFGPARGDERKDQEPRANRRFVGKIKSISNSLNAAFVDVGDGLDAYLPIKKSYSENVQQGAFAVVSVKSPPRQGKGAQLRYIEKFPAHATPGRLKPFEDPALEAIQAIGAKAEEIIVDDGKAKAFLEGKKLKAALRQEQHSIALFETHGVEAELAAAFEPVVSLQGGGRLFIEEFQALTAIDVDTGSIMAASSVRLREKAGTAAAAEAMRQLGLRNIGGHVVIDFPSIDEKFSRKRFLDNLSAAMSTIDGAGAGSFSKSGLFSFTLPHQEKSLLSRFTEISPSDPVSGRRYTLEWSVKSAMRTLEHHLRASPSKRFSLIAGEAISDYLGAHEVWMDRMQDKYGGRAVLETKSTIRERSFEIAER